MLGSMVSDSNEMLNEICRWQHTFRVVLMLFVISQPAVAGVTHLLYEEHAGQCRNTVSHDAVAGQPGVIILRPVGSGETPCVINKSQVKSLMEKGLQQYRGRKDLAPVTSVFLGGRLIAYPWLSRYVMEDARKNTLWNVDHGKPVSVSSNEYLNRSLFGAQVLAPFAEALQRYDYEITGVSCEKVLVNKNKLPFDGMCWLMIKSR